MLYNKSIKKSRYWIMFIIIGIISLLFGIINKLSLTEDAHDLNMLMGMFSGMGGAFVVLGIIQLVHRKTASAEKLKKEEIECSDERNVQITRISYTISSITATMLFAVLTFLFVYLGYRTAAFITMGALYVQVFAGLIATAYYKKKL